MNIFAPLLIMVLGQAAPSVSELSADDLLRRAQNHYAYGEYALAIPLVETALSGGESLSSTDLVVAQELLGLSAYLAKDLAKSRNAFTDLLLQRPEHALDPFSVAPPIIEFFENIRKELEPQLKALTNTGPPETPTPSTPRDSSRSQIIERIIVERSPLGLFMPFGYGQYQNGDSGLGHALLATQLTALAVNIGAYYLARSYRREPELGRLFSRLQYGGLALFGVSWSIGVVQARLNFVPRVVRPPIIRQASLELNEPSSSPIEAHAMLTIETW